jgi:hypothetical protein
MKDKEQGIQTNLEFMETLSRRAAINIVLDMLSNKLKYLSDDERRTIKDRIYEMLFDHIQECNKIGFKKFKFIDCVIDKIKEILG